MKKKPKAKQTQPVRKSPQPTQKRAKAKTWNPYAFLAIILLISLVCYLPALRNELLAWDDDLYITNNPLVHSINLADIFSQYVMGNYHPLTILTFAIQYQLFGLNETGYH